MWICAPLGAQATSTGYQFRRPKGLSPLQKSVAMACRVASMLLSWAAWAAVPYLGCVVSLGGYGLYNVGVHRLSAAQAAAYTNLIPVLTLLLGVWLLREVFLPAQYAASALIIAGVLLSQWRRS